MWYFKELFLVRQHYWFIWELLLQSDPYRSISNLKRKYWSITVVSPTDWKFFVSKWPGVLIHWTNVCILYMVLIFYCYSIRLSFVFLFVPIFCHQRSGRLPHLYTDRQVQTGRNKRPGKWPTHRTMGRKPQNGIKSVNFDLILQSKLKIYLG